jgi:two-component system cell cycle sensor histidine kinase/response regulator CckA
MNAQPASATRLRVLLVEDCAADAELTLDALRRAGFDPQSDRVETEPEYLAHLASDLDVILADHTLRRFDAVRALELKHDRGCDVPLIIVSGTAGEDNAVAAMRRGASDYLLKKRLARLGESVRLAMEATALRRAREGADLAERKSDDAAVLERHRLSAFARDVGVAFTQSATLAAMLDLSAQLIVSHLVAAVAEIWTRKPQEDGLAARGATPKIHHGLLQLMASAGRGSPADVPDRPVPQLRSTLDEIVRDRRTLVTNAVTGDPRIDQEWAAANGIVSFVGYPLIVGEHVVGVIAMFGRAPFSDATVQAISYIANAVASAIERQRIQEELLTSDERTRFALEAARMGIWELDLRTRRVNWSETMASILGCKPGMFDGSEEAFFALVHADDRDAIRQAIEGAVVERQGFDVAFRAIGPDGATCWIERRGRVRYDSDGVPMQIVGADTDVTERKLLETQLRQAQKMEAIGQLAGGIAHDFNNLLTAILGYAKFAADALEPGDQRRLDVEQAIKAAQRAAGLTKQLLAFSRKQVLRSTLVDLNALVTGVSQMLRQLIGEQIEIEMVLAPDLALVRADAGQLEQVVINLAVNARDAMEQGGRLTLETANLQLHAASGSAGQTVVPGWYVMLAVIDRGVGMDENTKQHLFEPFFTTKELGKGTGLGLATVHGIVKQSDGYIWVDSVPGRGSAFKVYLPRVERPVEMDLSAAGPRSPGGSETVLVVEDEAGVRDLARRILENAGYHVLEAANGRDAEIIFAQNRDSIDLLVTDVIMPRLNGPNLFRRLVAEKPGLKVVYVSGYATEAMARQVGLDRSRPYLQKPFTADQLASHVRNVLDGRLQRVN